VIKLDHHAELVFHNAHLLKQQSVDSHFTLIWCMLTLIELTSLCFLLLNATCLKDKQQIPTV